MKKLSLAQNPILMITLMFALTQIIGLISGILLISSARGNEYVQMMSVSVVEDSNSILNALLLILYVLLGAGIALLIIKFFRTKIIFRIMELVVVGGTVSVLLFSFIFALSGMGFFESLFASILAGGAFSIIKFFTPSLKNTAAILSSAGVAALFGFSLGFIPALAFILLLSLYDYIAVFKTRHMLTLAKGLGTHDMSFTITAKAKPPGKEKIKIEKIPENELMRLDLGSGDLAVPAVLAVSTYSSFGIWGAMAVAIGATVSIYLTLEFVIKRHVVLPALPPICLGSLIALFLAEIIKLAI